MLSPDSAFFGKLLCLNEDLLWTVPIEGWLCLLSRQSRHKGPRGGKKRNKKVVPSWASNPNSRHVPYHTWLSHSEAHALTIILSLHMLKSVVHTIRTMLTLHTRSKSCAFAAYRHKHYTHISTYRLPMLSPDSAFFGKLLCLNEDLLWTVPIEGWLCLLSRQSRHKGPRGGKKRNKKVVPSWASNPNSRHVPYHTWLSHSEAHALTIILSLHMLKSVVHTIRTMLTLHTRSKSCAFAAYRHKHYTHISTYRLPMLSPDSAFFGKGTKKTIPLGCGKKWAIKGASAGNRTSTPIFVSCSLYHYAMLLMLL